MADKGQILVREVIEAAGGEVVGRIRLQKIVYLLEQLGLKSGFSFSYYHYGPYSEGLAEAVERAQFFDKSVREDTGYTAYGNPFSIYSTSNTSSHAEFVGALKADEARRLIQLMKAEQSVVIELAATIHWLKHKEKITNWKAELKRRKASKADDVKIQQAERLLDALHLDVS
ncbi:hypothetical protein L0F51_17625 [Afifella sp. H1R]|uniref:hypothetical protein n=1 Tax=Afifella sp. H1R TaxID=2908841 RepID=UPI001F27CF82|nr:hypothetical protein [Afifella sp. H1R]MCF1505575.1 hypothetical protein [Afifella sp. H1R]